MFARYLYSDIGRVVFTAHRGVMEWQDRTMQDKAITINGSRHFNPLRFCPPRATAADRHRLIAQAAYLRAAQRDFASGNEIEDWLAAEREIDVMIATQLPCGP
jgi:hypothetical protein